MIVHLKNQAGLIREAKIGFSWTTFFFGAFVPIFRGDWKWFLIQLLVACLTWGISNLVFCFIYNKIYIKDLLEKGYVPADDASRTLLIQKGFLCANESKKLDA